MDTYTHSLTELHFIAFCTSEVHKYGILETDDEMKVIGFLEKPQPCDTTSRKEVSALHVQDFNLSNFMNMCDSAFIFVICSVHVFTSSIKKVFLFYNNFYLIQRFVQYLVKDYKRNTNNNFKNFHFTLI